MTLDARRHGLWTAMGLGPVWQQRAPSVPAPDAGADDPRAARIARTEWDALVAEVAQCRACPLGATRRQAVFGVGYRHAEWMLVGEAPGAEEDARGEPFVGQAGKLLDNMLASIGLTRAGETQRVHRQRAEVPSAGQPESRTGRGRTVRALPASPDRTASIRELVLVMGRFAAQALLGTDASIASLRGRVHGIASPAGACRWW